jgi:Predicted phosphoribosyltransferases
MGHVELVCMNLVSALQKYEYFEQPVNEAFKTVKHHKQVIFPFTISQANVVAITKLRTGRSEVRNSARKILSSPKRPDCLYSIGDGGCFPGL